MKQSSPRNCLTHTMEVVTDSGEISPENMGGGMAKEDEMKRVRSFPNPS